MTFATTLASLYAMSGIASCVCYGPQVLRLVRSAEVRRSMSLLSWGGWLGFSGVAFLYAMVLGPPEMVLVSGLGTLCQAIVVALALGQRMTDRKMRKGPAPRGASPLDPPVTQA
ncbi:MAG: hypothetical protein H7Z12_16925 [Rhodospirillaceae bacterium]|nr:hypothetical protein [Rhodospirillales bacterium]